MYYQSYDGEQPYNNRQNTRMEVAALTLAIIAMVSCVCLYLSIPCAALAIIFASLSRGGEMQYSTMAQIGLILGIIALVLTITLYAASFGVVLYQYGSIEEFLKAYPDTSESNFNDLMQQLMPSTQFQ